jgi:hypothetical protein
VNSTPLGSGIGFFPIRDISYSLFESFVKPCGHEFHVVAVSSQRSAFRNPLHWLTADSLTAEC